MIKRVAPPAFLLLCAITGLWPLISFLLQSGIQPSASSIGMSPLRLGLVVLVALLIGGFIFLGVREFLKKSGESSPIDILISHRFLVLFVFLLFTALLAAAYVFIGSPLQVKLLHNYYLRWQPIIVWLALIFTLFFLLALILRGTAYWYRAWWDWAHHPQVRKFVAWANTPTAGLVLLLVSLLIGLTKVWYGRFVDEADNLTLGWLVSQGYTLYKDVFSHHFPFPYYWVALVVGLFGNSFVAVRVSILLLQLGCFFYGMRKTGEYFLLGLVSIAWNLINQFHRGQEVLYATFEALFLVTAFVVIFYILIGKVKVTRLTLLGIGILLSLAILSDPLMVYPSGVALLFVFISGLRHKPGLDWRTASMRLLWAGGMLAISAGFYLLYLFATGSFETFYHSTIWFNAQVYAKYVDASPNRIRVIFENLLTGLKIFDSRWFSNTSPFMQLVTYRSVKLENEQQYFAWIFGGFLFRFSILACLAGLFLKRRFAAGIFLYGFSAALIVREDDGLYAMTFTLVSLIAASYFLIHLRRIPLFRLMHAKRKPDSWASAKPLTLAWIAVVVLLGIMQVWSAFRGAYYLFDNRNVLVDQRHVTMYKKFGKTVGTLTCDQAGVELAVYPINPIVYFVTGLQPASRYTWMYPWVAEVGQQELIAELRENPAAFVWINTGRKAGAPDAVAVYMAETIDFLNREYYLIEEDLWMSPQLAENCPVTNTDLPFVTADEDE